MRPERLRDREQRNRDMTQSTQEKLVSYLKATHALEQMSLQMTQAAAMASKDPQMRELFQHHHEETTEHERLIRQRIEAPGETVSKAKDLGGRFAALAKGAGALVGSDTPGRLARDGYVQEHTEVAAYELLRRVAERAADTETATVGRQILENERQTAEKIAASWDHAIELSLGNPARAPESPPRG
jgi:ferritin-like metal-binding protein YciE